MGTPASLSLEIIWKFISPILEEKLKEKVKRKDSSEQAKERAYKLYQNLDQMRLKAIERMAHFRHFIELLKQQPSKDEITHVGEVLDQSSEELMEVTSEMVNSLEALYPQLEIHQYELYQRIIWFKEWGSAQYEWSGISDAWIKFEDEEDFSDLKIALNEEERNLQRVERCLIDFREFIATQFPFPDSF